jgi:prefoldin subunit 5
VKKDAVKSMDKVIEVLDDKIEAMERQLSNLKERRASILDGSYPFHLV